MIGGSAKDLATTRTLRRLKVRATPVILCGVLVILFSNCSAAGPPEIDAESALVTTSDSLTSASPREMRAAPIATTAPRSEPRHSQNATDVNSAYQRRYEAYWECLRTPVDCDNSYLWPTGTAALHMAAVRAEMVARDRYVGPEPVGYYKVEQIQIAADQRSAEVIACWWSTAVLYGAPIYPDLPISRLNPSSLVTSTPEGGRQLDRFNYSDGAWLLVSSTALDQGFGEDPCSG
jgi:hypothetical protein